ncbi:MAG: Gfo/Idh/MocA family oxidoreductase [Armatimonadetes bacterium]|nr:Gfo/Idh/MocA family oxidoreductase [Armatimonadota bacterium]
MGNTHLAAWSKVESVRLLGVTDVDARRTQAAAEKHGVERWFTNLEEGLAQDGVDVVSVCLPSYLHRAASVAAMEAGKDVLCEKPISLTVEDAQAMIACRDRTGRTLGIAFCKRHLAQLAQLREWLAEGVVGRPVMYRMSGGLEIRFKPWIMDRSMGGGPIVDLCCHYFDQWRWLFDAEPVRVMAMGMTFASGAEELPGVDFQTDTAALCVEYGSGDVGTISLSWGLPRGTSAPGPEQVLGPRGVVTLEGFKGLRLARKGGQEESLADLDADLYGNQAAAFARAVREGTPPVTGAEDGLAALRVSLAVLESIETGRAVEPA